MEVQANLYTVVAVRPAFPRGFTRSIEAICLTPGKARELRRELLAGESDDIIRAYISISQADSLWASPYNEDEVLERGGPPEPLDYCEKIIRRKGIKSGLQSCSPAARGKI